MEFDLIYDRILIRIASCDEIKCEDLNYSVGRFGC